MSEPQYYEEEPQRSGMSGGTITAIVCAILFVVVGIPVLTCGGCMLIWGFQVRQAVNEFEEEIQEEVTAQTEREARAEAALKVRLKDVLYQHAKSDISSYWDPPLSRKWKGWYVEKVDSNTYSINGRLEGNGQVYNWRCEYYADDPMNATRDDWLSQRVIIDDKIVWTVDE